MRLINGIPIFGTHDDNTITQIQSVASNAVHTALMADGHWGYTMPVGGVAAYDAQVSVMGVGVDIGCGNAAIRTTLRTDAYTPAQWHGIADALARTISFGMGRSNAATDAPVDHPLFESDAWSLFPFGADTQRLRASARDQLGTVGGGNHYVDVFSDEAGFVWVGVHFGSRGLGHKIATGFQAMGQGLAWGARAPEREVLLSLNAPIGHDYWHLMELAGAYAYAGREWVARKVVALLGAQEAEIVHNHHNYAWIETHDDRELVVVRKGATPAFPGQKGFVGGSMGDDAVILEGRVDGDAEVQRATLYSTVHGAGRVMSRTAATGRKKTWGRKPAKVVGPGLISQTEMDNWVLERNVILKGAGRDEAPQAYRRLPEVLASQGETVRVLHTLRPVIVVMAPENEYDPFKD